MIKKKILMFYFILFIILNILDFFNQLVGDIDFIKKILSWIIIGYLFYSISFTKIFVGARYRIYDWGFLLSYLLLTLPRILFHYVSTLQDISEEYIIFDGFLLLFKNNFSSSNEITIYLSIISIALILFISTVLFFKEKTVEPSFIGGLNFEPKLISKSLQLGLLYFISLFFGYSIFTFFIEWFALAVDSLILVLGLIYYMFEFIKHHTNSRGSQLLWSISNTGNNFYKELIIFFSQRKTFFIGVSFFLVIHLLVDVGIYIIPYGIGTTSPLYFSSLDTAEKEHTPLFNIFDSSNSQFSEDITKIDSIHSTSTMLFLAFSLLLIYIFHFSAYFLLLLLPFLIYYYNTKKKELKIPTVLLEFFLIATIFTGIFSLFLSQGFNEPVSIGMSSNSAIEGVDIYTSEIISTNYDDIALELIGVIVVIIFIFLFLNYGAYRFTQLLTKFAYIIILVFFIYYIGLFYFSSISQENALSKDFQEIESFYLESAFKGDTKNQTAVGIEISATPFSSKNKGQFNLEDHKDYIYYTLSSQQKLYFKSSEAIVFKEKEDSFEYQVYYYVGENIFTQDNYNFISTQEMYNKLTKVVSTQPFEKELEELLMSALENIRLFFLTIFYLLGTLFYSIHFLKNNLFS